MDGQQQVGQQQVGQQQVGQVPPLEIGAPTPVDQWGVAGTRWAVVQYDAVARVADLFEDLVADATVGSLDTGDLGRLRGAMLLEGLPVIGAATITPPSGDVVDPTSATAAATLAAHVASLGRPDIERVSATSGGTRVATLRTTDGHGTVAQALVAAPSADAAKVTADDAGFHDSELWPLVLVVAPALSSTWVVRQVGLAGPARARFGPLVQAAFVSDGPFGTVPAASAA